MYRLYDIRSLGGWGGVGGGGGVGHGVNTLCWDMHCRSICVQVQSTPSPARPGKIERCARPPLDKSLVTVLGKNIVKIIFF